jgi:hypothetical protein
MPSGRPGMNEQAADKALQEQRDFAQRELEIRKEKRDQ